MIKDFIVRKMLERQLKGLPQDQQDMIIRLVSENPDFFKKIQKEVKEKEKGGMDPKLATMFVMKKYQSDLQRMYQSQIAHK